MRNVLGSAGIDDDLNVALIGSLLGVADGNAPILGDVSPQRRKQLTFDALIAWLRADSRVRPIVVLVEDLHWIDASSRELLGLLLQRIEDAPVLLLFTFRPEFVPPWPPAENASSISLTKLGPDQVAAVARGMTAGRELPAKLLEEIALRADGVPLFVEEMTKAVLASGLLVEREGELALAPGATLQMAVPSTLRDSLTARLDRLGAAKAIAQLASVLGREFDYALLQSICDEPGLEEHLATLNLAEVIQQSGAAPRSRYAFRHALIQEAAYETLLKSTRQQHHRRVAQSLVERFSGTAQSRPEVVAHHYSHALQADAAVPYWQRAGELALERSGHEEAIAHLNAAIDQVNRIPDSPARRRMELSLRVKVGPALSVKMGFGSPEAGENYKRACELSEGTGATSERFAALWNDWLYKNAAGQLAAAAQRSEDLVVLSHSLDDRQYALQACHSRWTNFFFLGDVRVARADTLRGIALYDRTLHQHHKHLYGGHDPGVCACNFGAVSAWLAGSTREALALVQKSLSLASELDHAHSTVIAYNFASMVFHGTAAHAQTQASADELASMSGKLGMVQFLGPALVMAGAARASQGDTTLGLKLVEDGLKSHRKVTFATWSPMMLTMAASTHRQSGSDARAFELLSDALEGSKKSHVGWYVPEAMRLHAEMLLESGRANIDEAATLLRESVALARTQGAVAFEWRAAASLARVYEKAGRIDEARNALRGTLATAGELDSPELDAAQRQLAALG